MIAAADTNVLIRILLDDSVWVMECAYKVEKPVILKLLNHLDNNPAFVL